ncbi:DUF1659 domain-containing protein [Anoxynatronum buryatiense]|uniref:DUF1659 domain-containing protein n=1 Tax=Anoxynatronum buryatiense TaxID=489973 RepID=A0AA45WX45_9CLOT|nr:DUF1659 domain-containing protein [Anoxynatronum buryatiense]SMP57106.1 Protein of unknown function [Anoxynatronum buryatiense]
MPIQIINEQARLRLRYIDSVDGEGNEKLSTRSFSGVKTTAADEDLLEAAQTMASLQTKPVKHVIRAEEKEIIEA